MTKPTTFTICTLALALGALPNAAAAAGYFGREHTTVMNRIANANAAHNATIRRVQRDVSQHR